MPIENESYYLDQLHQQTALLIDACHNYDNGTFYQAKNMSAIIRTFVKDPEIQNNSKRKIQTVSLLKSLEVKDTMKFYNTGFEAVDPDISINLVGLVSVPSKAPNNNQFEHIYLPVLNKSAQIDCKWLDFDTWWKSKIIVSKSEKRNIEFTRKKITLTMAEQDGGVHIDSFENIDKDYRDIALSIANIFTNVDSKGNESSIKYLQYALVRQISHELIISLKKVFNLSLEYNPTNKINLRGVSETNIKHSIILAKGEKLMSTRTKFPCKIAPGSTIKAPPNAAYMKLFL